MPERSGSVALSRSGERTGAWARYGGTGTNSRTFHPDQEMLMTDPLMTDDETAVRAACTTFGQAMQAMDLEALKGLWDDGYEHLVYQPEEYEAACMTWDAIVDYWRYIPGVIGRILEWREISSDVAVLGDAALVYSRWHTAFEFKDSDESLAGDVRISAALRRTDDGWRFIQLHESRQLVAG
jgi:ketosteroid isomerase-like protein